MTAAQIVAWIQVVNVLVSAGIATVSEIRAWMAALKSPTPLTEAEMNTILDSVAQDAITRAAQAKAASGL
jgi:hypothetical protein